MDFSVDIFKHVLVILKILNFVLIVIIIIEYYTLNMVENYIKIFQL